MSYSVHTLNIENHFHIIGRQDGVTGDRIIENTRVVFCSACQSVFLRESWEYINLVHCNQSETLNFVPSPIPVLIAKKKEAKLIFETFSTLRSRILGTFGVIFFIAFTIGWIYFLFYTNQFLPKFSSLVTSIIYISLYFLGQMGSMFLVTSTFQNKLFRKIIGIDKRTLRIFENEIEIKKEKTYSFYQIRKIHYSKTKKENRLLIYLKNGEIIQHKLPKNEYQKTKDFLFGLVWVAQFVQTTVCVEDKKEYGIAKSIERNYVAHFLVVEHLKN